MNSQSQCLQLAGDTLEFPDLGGEIKQNRPEAQCGGTRL